MRCEERERKITPNNSRQLSQNAFMCVQLLLLSTIKVHKKVILAFKHPLLLMLRAVKWSSSILLCLATIIRFNNYVSF